MTLMSVLLASYIANCDIDTPVKPMTAIIQGKTIKISETEKNKNTYISASFPEDEQWIDIIESFYTSSIADCGKTDAISASGIKLSRGGYIAAPHDIPFGTKIVVDEDDKYKEYEVADGGNAIKWLDNNTMKIDIFVPNATAKQIRELGIKKYKGKIISNQP